MGRWLSPDPAGVKAAHPDDPQTWNMYAYVRNNPTTFTDPTGRDFYQTCHHSKHNTATCQQVQNGSKKIWVQGTTDNGKFNPNRIANYKGGLVDVNHGYTAVSGTFDQTGVNIGGAKGVFMQGSGRTDISGSGLFSGITGAFVSACGGSCEARGELLGTPNALATMEAKLNPQSKAGTAIDQLSGAHNSGAQWKDSDGYKHVILNGPDTLNACKLDRLGRGIKPFCPGTAGAYFIFLARKIPFPTYN